MKILFTLCLAFSFAGFSQKLQFGTYVPVDIPMRHKMPYMSTNVGLGFGGAYKPVSQIPVFAELKGSFGGYSNRTLQQTYIFGDGSSTVTDVRFSSNMHKLLLGTKVVFGSEYKGFRMYLTPQAGFAFMNSRIFIEDPTDVDGCKALERKKTQRFAGFIYGGELGAEISMDRIFKGIVVENRHRLIFAMTYMRGTRPFEYVNIKYMKDNNHGVAGEHDHHMNDEDRTDIETTFINVSSNNTHEHKIAELYRTPFEFVGFNIGYVISF